MYSVIIKKLICIHLKPVKNLTKNAPQIQIEFMERQIKIKKLSYDLANFSFLITLGLVFFTIGLDCKSSKTFNASST